MLLIRAWIIGILLAGAAVFFGYKTYQVWIPNVELETHQPVAKPIKPDAGRIAYRSNPRYNSYEVIAEKDLFSKDRRETLPEEPEEYPYVEAPTSLDDRFVLFGIVINGDEKKALVSNFYRQSDEEKVYIWVKVGDKIGDLNVTEIKPHQVVVTDGSTTYIIRLSSQNHPLESSGE